jgi:K+-sensing histidine kinase KdpD
MALEVREALGAGLRSVEATASGSAAREIVAYAARHGIDLIVIGTHGHTGVSRALLGSVAEAVVRRADLPRSHRAGPARARPRDADSARAREVRGVRPALGRAHLRAMSSTLIRGESLQRKFADERAGRLQGR